MDIREFDERQVFCLPGTIWKEKFGIVRSVRDTIQDNSVAVGSAWWPAFCSSSKKKPVPQKSEPRIGCGATCRAALLLVASRQLKLVQPPIPRSSVSLRVSPSPLFFLSVPSHYRGSCFNNFEPSICASMRGTDIRELLETAISRLQFFYIYSLSLTLSLYLG